MAFSKREEPEQQFSTFADLSNHEFRWQEEPRLKHSMAQKLGEKSSGRKDISNADFWVAYWHQRWQSKSPALPKAHLYAYLQEPCYWNAQDLYRRFNPVNLEVEDCFQAAICRSEKILRRFNPAQGASLATYSSRAFGNAIRDTLERDGSLNLCSDLSLLRRTSKRVLKEALQASGIPQSMEASYEAAWQCFKAVFSPPSKTTRDLRHLSHEDWAAIAKEYSKQKAGRSDLVRGDIAELKTWLAHSVLSLRRYKAPPTISLNNACFENEEEFLDQLTDGKADAMARLEAHEAEQTRQQLLQQVAKVLSNTFEGLGEAKRTLLQLYYGEGLKQTEIAKRLKVDQSKVSRHLNQIKRAFLKDLMIWLREELHISSDPPVQKEMSILLQEWLTLQFS